MGRQRKHNRHLPQRVYQRRGAFYYVDAAGKWHPLGKNYAEALRKLAAIVDTSGPATTFAQLVAKYTAEELGRKAEKTRRGRLQEFKPLLKVFGRMNPAKIESYEVWNYFTERKRTEQARHEIRALSTLLTYARRIGARKTENPCFGLQLPSDGPRRRYVTDDEYLLVRGVAQPMIALAMDLSVAGGMDQATIRKLERRHLTADGILFERSKTAAKKGGSMQLVKWNDDLRGVIDALKREPPQLRHFLICNRRGKPYSANGFQSQWQRTMIKAKAAGLVETFHFHDLRAKSASDAESDQVAADRLGHGDPNITREVYRRLPRVATAGTLPKKAEQ